MPQNTPGQARVIDPVLTEVARGYQNAEMVGMGLFPYVPVGQRGGKIIQFGKEHFRLYNTARAPGGKVVRIASGYGSQAYALESHAVEEGVPDEQGPCHAGHRRYRAGPAARGGSLGLPAAAQTGTERAPAGGHRPSAGTARTGVTRLSAGRAARVAGVAAQASSNPA